MQDVLTKIASAAFFQKAKELTQEQADMAAPGPEKHKTVVDGLVQFIDDLDEVTVAIPYIGSILAELVDTQAAQDAKRQAVQVAVEFIYQTLKLDGQA